METWDGRFCSSGLAGFGWSFGVEAFSVSRGICRCWLANWGSVESWAVRIFFRVSGSVGWTTLSMIDCRHDEDCLLWDEDLHDVTFGCFLGGLIPLPVVGYGFDNIRF